MPIEFISTLIVSLIILAFSTSLHAAVSLHRLKMANDEITAFIAKIDALKNENNKEISNISELHEAEIIKLDHSYTKAMNKAIQNVFKEHEKFTNIIHNDDSLVSKIKIQLGMEK